MAERIDSGKLLDLRDLNGIGMICLKSGKEFYHGGSYFNAMGMFRAAMNAFHECDNERELDVVIDWFDAACCKYYRESSLNKFLV
ncbi:MAG TPA: hypothetical protein VJZ93_02415 [Candidatus Nanoarchaeia archaeon]|nr:hypothetical protein [Candidatus Nanoarchaeia archaeon]